MLSHTRAYQCSRQLDSRRVGHLGRLRRSEAPHRRVPHHGPPDSGALWPPDISPGRIQERFRRCGQRLARIRARSRRVGFPARAFRSTRQRPRTHRKFQLVTAGRKHSSSVVESGRPALVARSALGRTQRVDLVLAGKLRPAQDCVGRCSEALMCASRVWRTPAGLRLSQAMGAGQTAEGDSKDVWGRGPANSPFEATWQYTGARGLGTPLPTEPSLS